MMNEILARCAEAAEALDAESDRFDELRDLRSRLPQVLAELPAAIETQQSRLAGATATLKRLQQQFLESLQSVKCVFYEETVCLKCRPVIRPDECRIIDDKDPFFGKVAHARVSCGLR